MATYEDFTIDQGADLALQIELVNPDGSKKDLTGYSASAKMKKTYRRILASDSKNWKKSSPIGAQIQNYTNSITPLHRHPFLYTLKSSNWLNILSG